MECISWKNELIQNCIEQEEGELGEGIAISAAVLHLPATGIYSGINQFCIHNMLKTFSLCCDLESQWDGVKHQVIKNILEVMASITPNRYCRWSAAAYCYHRRV